MTSQPNIPLRNSGILITLGLLILISISFALHPQGGVIFLLPTAIGIGLFAFFRKIRLKIFSRYQGEFDSLQEQINLLMKSIEEKKKVLESLPFKNQRVSFLFNVSQNLIELIDPEKISDTLITVLDGLFSTADSILFFRFDKEEQDLNLSRSLKRKDYIIKEKHGDALDKWVLRHNCSLLIDNIVEDFRFDYNTLQAYKERGMHSFMISPLSIGYRLLGAIRVESTLPAAFYLDDSRLLRNVCDLGAVVLERAILFQKAQDLAIKDSLTGLFVRNYFFQRLSNELKRKQPTKTGLGLIMLDIDNFKEINDIHGHVVGDLVLTKVAQILRVNIEGAGNIAARFGGEEFIVLIVEAARERVLECAESIRKLVDESELIFRRKKIRFTISLGAVSCPQDGNSVTTLIERVDQLLYQAKREGKNRLCYSR